MSIKAELFDLKAEILTRALRRRQSQGRIDKDTILDQLRSGTSMEKIYLSLVVVVPPKAEPKGATSADGVEGSATGNSNSGLFPRFRRFVQWLIGR